MHGTRDIVVCSVGGCSAVGGSAAAGAAAIRAGISASSQHPYMVDRQGDRMITARAPYIDPEMPVDERIITLIHAAAAEAAACFADWVRSPHRIHVIVGLPEPRPGLPLRLAETVDRQLQNNPQLPCARSLETISQGHASGVNALKRASDLLDCGHAEVCLVGAGDSYHAPESLEWLDENDQLRSSQSAWGFVPGEGAGFAVLATRAIAERCGAAPIGQLKAAAEAVEPNRIKTDTVCLGLGLTEAVRQVLRAVSSADDKVHQTICDLNGEAYRADEFGFMLARTSEYFVDATDVHTPADCWGDVGAASGLLFLTLWAAGKLRNYKPGPGTLIWTSSEGGHRAAALLD